MCRSDNPFAIAPSKAAEAAAYFPFKEPTSTRLLIAQSSAAAAAVARETVFFCHDKNVF
jgi:hypothetical protein